MAEQDDNAKVGGGKARKVSTRIACTIPGAPTTLNHKGQLIRLAQIKVDEQFFHVSEEISPAIADELYQLGIFTPFAQGEKFGDAIDEAIEAAQREPEAQQEAGSLDELRRELEDHQRANLNLTADVQAARKANEQLVADNEKLRTENAALRELCTKNSIPLPK